MDNIRTAELKRRTVIKSLLWRIIGVVWTWIGAYFIILVIPPSVKNAPVIATLIVVYHHSTRMVMYYFYERIWASISWGKCGKFFIDFMLQLIYFKLDFLQKRRCHLCHTLVLNHFLVLFIFLFRGAEERVALTI